MTTMPSFAATVAAGWLARRHQRVQACSVVTAGFCGSCSCWQSWSAAPAQAQYHIYWGDMHGHTAISDGKGSLDDYFTHARDVAKLDFVVVSDHDFGNAAPWKMPKETWTLTQDKVDQYTVNGKFVAIAGYEWTSQPKYWTPEEPLFTGPVKYYNHKNVYFPARVDYLFSAKDPAYNSPNLLAEAVQKHGGLIQNNHLDAGPEGRDQFDYDRRLLLGDREHGDVAGHDAVQGQDVRQ